LAPARHAVNIGHHARLSQRQERLIAPLLRVLHEAPDAKRPVGEPGARHVAVVQHRPAPGEVLTGRQALGRRFAAVALGREVEGHEQLLLLNARSAPYAFRPAWGPEAPRCSPRGAAAPAQGAGAVEGAGAPAGSAG